MEPRFKTSFIPKQSFAPPAQVTSPSPSRQGLGIMGVASLTIFVVALVVTGGAYAYKYYLESAIEGKSKRLQAAREAFQPALIRELERLDNRLTAATDLLSAHSAPTGLFALLESVTYADVQFKKMTFTRSEQDMNITLEGEARDFDAVALQSDVFANNSYILQPVFSNLNVVDANRVSFSVQATIDRRFLSYASQLSARAGKDTSSPLAAPASPVSNEARAPVPDVTDDAVPRSAPATDTATGSIPPPPPPPPSM